MSTSQIQAYSFKANKKDNFGMSSEKSKNSYDQSGLHKLTKDLN